MLAACQTMSTAPDGAAGPTGPSAPGGAPIPTSCTANSSSMIVVKYGDSSIEVTHKVNVNKNENFKIRLDPANASSDPVNYKTMNVYFFGSTTNAQWLTEVYNADGQNQKDFTICADAPAGEYKYMVVIPGIGTIDPRVEIEN